MTSSSTDDGAGRSHPQVVHRNLLALSFLFGRGIPILGNVFVLVFSPTSKGKQFINFWMVSIALLFYRNVVLSLTSIFEFYFVTCDGVNFPSVNNL